MLEDTRTVFLSQLTDPTPFLEQFKETEWPAGQRLYDMIVNNELAKRSGDHTEVALLIKGDKLLSYCILAERDDIQPTDLRPWMGYLYTFPSYRGQGCAPKLLSDVEKIVRQLGFEALHISTGHKGLYEKYGYEFWGYGTTLRGVESRIYKKVL